MTSERKCFATVVTTIQEPTDGVRHLALKLKDNEPLFIVGDGKGPERYNVKNSIFLSLEEQFASSFVLARRLPVGHYARKNLGYLEAIKAGASCIYETDDDNEPLANWKRRQKEVRVLRVFALGWVNVYRSFTEEKIWPRGFPLDEVAASCAFAPQLAENTEILNAPIQQGLVDNCPDVDAVWRLVFDRPFEFEKNRPSIYLPPGAWCPFNSQSTWWWPEAYPLLYLPSHCSFRMTDIWRSLIAQRCLWENGFGVVFHGPEMKQRRNPHDLINDFDAEISGYLHNREILKILENLNLTKGAENTGANFFSCYEALVKNKIFEPEEIMLVETWLDDIHDARKNSDE